MNLTKKLLHRITVTPVTGQNADAEPTGTVGSSVACFIDGTYRRVLKADGRAVVISFSIYFSPSVDIGIDYLVTNGVAKDGTVVLASGRIVHVEKSFHPQRGLIVQEALVESN